MHEQGKRISVGSGTSKKGANIVWISPETEYTDFELDEVFWFIERRKGCENRVNTFIMTMLSRKPHQIAAFAANNSVNSKDIQRMVDSVKPAKKYFTDGGMTYLDVDFYGRHIRNIHDKSNTHIIEGSNADLRHYIAGLRRKSRCFFRSLETLKAVLNLFINAYNKFGAAKHNYLKTHPNFKGEFPFNHLSYI